MLVQTLGLEASASTWLYNVSRDIIATAHPGLYAIESTNVAPLQKRIEVDSRLVHEYQTQEMADPSTILIKSHNCDNELMWLINATQSPVILSVRDPRDSVASMINRLGEREQSWVENIVRSIAAIFTSRHLTRNIMFQYESRFFEQPETLDEIAAFLGLKLDMATRDEIFARFTKERVATLVSGMESLPATRQLKDHMNRLSDLETMFNSRHIGDGKSGKWATVIREPLRPAIDRALSGLVGKTQLDASVTLRFPEVFFSPHMIEGQPNYVPAEEGGRMRLLRHCWLPRGVWHVSVSGSLPATMPVRLSVSQGGEVVHRVDLEASELTAIDFSFEMTNRLYSKDLVLSVTAYDTGPLDPLRAGAVELAATFVRHI
jgi:hypothetical protein